MTFAVRLRDGTVLQLGVPRALRHQQQYTVTLRQPPPRPQIRRRRAQRGGGQALEERVRRMETALAAAEAHIEHLRRCERGIRYTLVQRVDRPAAGRSTAGRRAAAAIAILLFVLILFVLFFGIGIRG